MEWYKQKTFWTALIGMLTACGAYFMQEISLGELVAAIFTGFSVIFLRQGVAKVAPLLLVAVLFTTACNLTYHDKRTIFQTGAVTNNAGRGVESLEPVVNDKGEVIGFAAGTPSGSGATGEGTGGTTTEPVAGGGRGAGGGDTRTGAMDSSGFIIISIGQNDGVEQKADAAVDATATLTKSKTPATGTVTPVAP